MTPRTQNRNQYVALSAQWLLCRLLPVQVGTAEGWPLQATTSSLLANARVAAEAIAAQATGGASALDAATRDLGENKHECLHFMLMVLQGGVLHL